MILQISGSQLVRLMTPPTDAPHLGEKLKGSNFTPNPVCQCGKGDHSKEMTDLRPRFVPPRLDL